MGSTAVSGAHWRWCENIEEPDPPAQPAPTPASPQLRTVPLWPCRLDLVIAFLGPSRHSNQSPRTGGSRASEPPLAHTDVSSGQLHSRGWPVLLLQTQSSLAEPVKLSASQWPTHPSSEVQTPSKCVLLCVDVLSLRERCSLLLPWRYSLILVTHFS